MMEDKIVCPMMSTGDEFDYQPCVFESCGWWSSVNECCALASLADTAGWVAERLEKMVGDRDEQA